ncbi:MAG TPA: hypothetical protein DD381_06555 [Lentisphaeria bacterium]|nr:MAG: hypothetical protein A2X47_13225 [Lentisphaerae bacterium GWF2_38_69]HBM15986.1 hypothetical protein [Lentisphaeria bacterium]
MDADFQLTFDFMSETSENTSQEYERKPHYENNINDKDLRRSVIGWLLKSTPSGIGYDVPTRLVKIRGNIAAFWSKTEIRKKKKYLVPCRTAIVEVRSNREDCISDCGKNSELKEILSQEKRNKLYFEASIREKEPELKLSDNLFSDIESWDYKKTKNKDYHKCCSLIERLERSINKGSTFEKIKSALLADSLYLAVPRGLIKKDELTEGWGLLYINNDMSVDLIVQTESCGCPIENKLHLVQNIAKSNISSLCFANGINLDKNNSPRFVRIPRKRRS